MNDTLTTRYYKSTEPGFRFRADLFYDQDTPNPIHEDYFESKLSVAAAGYDAASHMGLDHFALQEALERMNKGLASVWKGKPFEHLENLVASVNRYAALAGKEERVFLFHHSGYSQSDWAAVLMESDNEDMARRDFELWSGWARGDVYGVEIQREEYDSDDDEWYEVGLADALWGIDGFELDYDAAIQYAVEYVAPLDLVHEELTP